MGRPCKNIDIQSAHNSKAYIQARKEQEEKLKGNADNIHAPNYLNQEQVQIFDFIVSELKASNILSNLDIYVLATCSIAISRLIDIEKMINKDSSYLLNKALLSAKNKYTNDFFRCCVELSLSPQSRAKLGNINAQAKEQEQDQLLKILKDEE